MKPTFQGELMLLGATADTVTFAVPKDERHQFLFDICQKGCAGHRYAAVFVEISNDQTAEPRNMPGKGPNRAPAAMEGSPMGRTIAAGRDALRRARDGKTPPVAAGILCRDSGFQLFLGVLGDDHAAMEVRKRCGVESRSNLRGEAATAFLTLMNTYSAWLNDQEAKLCGGG